MRHVGSVLVLMAVVLAGGCFRSAQVKYDAKLKSAKESLVSGDVAGANRHLSDAAVLAKEKGLDRTETTLLLAESALHSGDSFEAIRLAQEAQTDDPGNPRAEEIVGKALLKAGRFSEAQRSLDAARSGYTRQADIQRIDDLLSIAKGLTSYSEGDPEVARQYWLGIEDVAARHSVDKVFDEVTSGQMK